MIKNIKHHGFMLLLGFAGATQERGLSANWKVDGLIPGFFSLCVTVSLGKILYHELPPVHLVSLS